MYYDLPKSQKKIARILMDKGLMREFENGINQVDSTILRWKNGELDNREAYHEIYKQITLFDKHIGKRYDHIGGSRYVEVLLGQLVDGIITIEELDDFDEKVRNDIIRLYRIITEEE
jgi:hypothetical protein